MKKQGVLSKIVGGGIDNQLFMRAILSIVRRPFEGRSKVYAWWTHGGRLRLSRDKSQESCVLS